MDSEEFNTKYELLSQVADQARQRMVVPRSQKFSRADVVNAITGVFELIGGVPRFALWAHENPTEYYRIYAKLLPSQQQVTVAHEHSGEIRLHTDAELQDVIAKERERLEIESTCRRVDNDNE